MKPGEVVAGRYRLDARIGVGGMGEVWKATHDGTGREFAIKFMHAHAATSGSARQRFAREARVSAKINHPNVIDVFDAGEHDEGMLYMTMELLDGISLADALHMSPPLSVQDLFVLMHDTARALAAAHAVGVVHRDIKPANVFLNRDRATGFASAKVLDFGISKFGSNEDSHQTKTGAVLGSPRYMSPEQTRASANVDPRTDIWACGVILFEGLTGTWPHKGDSFSSLVVAICTEPPLSIDEMAPHLPEPVRALVRDCLKPRDERIGSAAALADRLAAVLQDKSLAKLRVEAPKAASTEALRVVSGMRIRPLLTTTGGETLVISAPVAGEGLHVAPHAPREPINGTLAMDPPLAPAITRDALDSATGTLDTLATTTVREPLAASSGSMPPSPPVLPIPRPPQAPRGPVLIALTVMGLLFAAVVTIGLVGSGSKRADDASATSAPVSGAPVADTGTETSAPPRATTAPASPTAAATPTASASASATSAPAKATRPAPAPPPPPPRVSKVKQLGSGL